MPATLVYTQGRRTVMQAVMWLVLLGAVGLAALVDRRMATGASAELGPAVNLGQFTIRFPAHWQVNLRTHAVPWMLALARETPFNYGPQMPSRLLIVYGQRIRPLISPDDYLDKTGLSDSIFNGADVEEQPAILAGFPAIRRISRGPVPTGDGNEEMWQMVICAVLPTHQTVTLQLASPVEFSPDDAELLDDVAAAVKAPGVNAPQ